MTFFKKINIGGLVFQPKKIIKITNLFLKLNKTVVDDIKLNLLLKK